LESLVVGRGCDVVSAIGFDPKSASLEAAIEDFVADWSKMSKTFLLFH
jgi:hypothetical protein